MPQHLGVRVQPVARQSAFIRHRFRGGHQDLLGPGRAHLDHVAVGGGAVPRELAGQDAGGRPDEQHIDRREPHGARASVEICQRLDNLRLVHAKIVHNL